MPPSPDDPLATSSPAPATLRWALGADPGSLDPREVRTVEERVVVGALFDSLTTLDERDRPVPALATTWSVGAGGREYVFALDPAARWHDGSPVVATDVLRGWRRILDTTELGPSPAAGLLDDLVGSAITAQGGPLIGARAEDDHTLVVELSRPVPELPAVLSHPALAPVPPAATDDPAAFGEAPIGNGPFLLGEPWAHNQFLRLVASEEHPAPPSLDEVVFRVYAGDDDGAQGYDDLLSGAIRVARVPPGRRAEARQLLGSSDGDGQPGVVDTTIATASFLLLDTTTPPLDDTRVRRALSLLVDRPGMAARSADERVAAEGLVPPSVPDSPPGTCRWCNLDVGLARELLADAAADLPEGESLAPVTIVTSPDELHREMADDLAARLRAGGLVTRVVAPDALQALDVVGATEEAVAVRLAWVAPVPTLGAWTGPLFGADAPARLVTGFAPPSLRELLSTSGADPDVGVRRVADQTVLRLLLDEAVVVPLVHYRDDLAIGEGVLGLVRSVTGDVDLSGVRLVEAST